MFFACQTILMDHHRTKLLLIFTKCRFNTEAGSESNRLRVEHIPYWWKWIQIEGYRNTMFCRHSCGNASFPL